MWKQWIGNQYKLSTAVLVFLFCWINYFLLSSYYKCDIIYEPSIKQRPNQGGGGRPKLLSFIYVHVQVRERELDCVWVCVCVCLSLSLSLSLSHYLFLSLPSLSLSHSLFLSLSLSLPLSLTHKRTLDWKWQKFATTWKYLQPPHNNRTNSHTKSWFHFTQRTLLWSSLSSNICVTNKLLKNINPMTNIWIEDLLFRLQIQIKKHRPKKAVLSQS